MAQQPNPSANLEARRKYAEAFDDTLLKMWSEKQYKLFAPSVRVLQQRQKFGSRYNWRRAAVTERGRARARRTGTLIQSTRIKSFAHDSDYSDLTYTEEFADYGIFVDAGVGREVYRGNPGDIGRNKVRKPKPWFSRKYYMSVMNLRDFYCESFALDAVHLVAAALDDKAIRNQIDANRSRARSTSGPGSNLTHGIGIPGLNLPL